MSMLGLESLNPRASVAAQNYATQFLTADVSEMMTVSDEALANANTAAAGIDAICNIFDVATVCKRFDGMTKSVEALVGKEVVSLEYKDERTLWTKIKEFFVRLWHSIRDWFAKFNIGLNRCLKQLQGLTSSEWKGTEFDADKQKSYKGLDASGGSMSLAEVNFKEISSDNADHKVTSVAEIITLVDNGSQLFIRNTPPDKLSDFTKKYSNVRKALVAAAKSDNEVKIESADKFNKLRAGFIADIQKIIRLKDTIVRAFEETVKDVEKGYTETTAGKDTSTDKTENSAKIRSLKDQRHELMMLAVTLGKCVVSNANKFIAAVKKIKKDDSK